MANLRFSPGLLSSIRDFGSSLTEAPASRANTLTGAGVQPASLGGMLARNVGGLMGRDMRTPQEKAQAELQGATSEAEALRIMAKYASPDKIPAIQRRIEEISKTETQENLVEKQQEGKTLIQDVLLTAEDIHSQNTLETVSTLQSEYGVSSKELQELYTTTQKARGLKPVSATSGNVSSKPRGMVRDPETNKAFYVTELAYQDGTIETKFTDTQGIEGTPGPKAYPISGTTGSSQAEKDAAIAARDSVLQEQRIALENIKTELKIGEEEAKLWLAEKTEASKKVAELYPKLTKAYEMRALLPSISTGGVVPSMYKTILTALGVDAEGVVDAGRFEKLAKEQMIALLGNFGSNPTEGERASASELVASLNDVKGLNARTIESFISELEYSYDDYRRVLREGATPSSVAQARLQDIETLMGRTPAASSSNSKLSSAAATRLSNIKKRTGP